MQRAQHCSCRKAFLYCSAGREGQQKGPPKTGRRHLRFRARPEVRGRQPLPRPGALVTPTRAARGCGCVRKGGGEGPAPRGAGPQHPGQGPGPGLGRRWSGARAAARPVIRRWPCSLAGRGAAGSRSAPLCSTQAPAPPQLQREGGGRCAGLQASLWGAGREGEEGLGCGGPGGAAGEGTCGRGGYRSLEGSQPPRGCCGRGAGGLGPGRRRTASGSEGGSGSSAGCV